jgi:hypothetical protein
MQPQKEPTASRALYQRPDTAGVPLLVRRLLSKFAGSRMASSINRAPTSKHDPHQNTRKSGVTTTIKYTINILN